MSDIEKYTKNRFVAFLDIMGTKNILASNNGAKGIYDLYTELDDATQIYRSDLIVTYYSDSIIAASFDDTIQGFESIVLYCAMIEACCIRKGYAVNGAVSFGSITIDTKRNIWLGEPLSKVYEMQNRLFFYGIVLDEKAKNKSEEFGELPIAFTLHISDLVTEMMIPIKDEGWKMYSCVNWFEFISDKVGNPYQDQIILLKNYIKLLYEKYKEAGRGFYYISNTEVVAKRWFDYLGKVNESTEWGNLILYDYLV